MIYVLRTLLLFTFLPFSFAVINEAKAQDYLPVGPQTNVPVSTVTEGGWTECYRDFYNNNMNANTVLSACQGERLMLSCRSTGSNTLTLLAQSDRSDVTFDTGNNTNVTHTANGIAWYFHDGRSWGFARAGDSVNKSSCDTQQSNANERLCWHLSGFIGGWRCGAVTGLNGSTAFERIVYVPTPERAINLSPESATNEVFTEHTVTVFVLSDGIPGEGILVDFEIISGPNAGEVSDPGSGECVPNDCTTDANGEVSWTYSSSHLGTDTIVAFSGDEESNTVEKTWVITRAIPTLSQWGLIAMAGLIGIIGFFAIRRRVTA